jgi:toxin ParE1/3/4
MQLRWALRARRDLFDIADHHEELDPDVADRMLLQIETAPLFLIEHPNAGPLIPDTSLRKWKVRKTPFLIFYRVGRNVVEVARVVHSATNWRADI